MAEIPFPGGAADGDVFFHEDKVCIYHKDINTWECRTIEAGNGVGQPEAVTTQTVYTIPLSTTFENPSPLELPDLRTQYDVNWWFGDKIINNARLPIISASPPTNHPHYPTTELVEGDLWINATNELYYWNSDEWIQVRDEDDAPVYVGTNPPVRVEGNKEGDLWWDSSEEEGVLYVWYNNPDGEGYWVPAAPPVSLDGINATIDAALVVQGELQQRVAAGEATQATILERLEQEVVSKQYVDSQDDKKFDKTGGDITGYVYSKGDNSGYYLGSEDGSLLANFREKLSQEATLELRGSTTFKLNGYAPGDNQAFPYVHLDTSQSNGLQIHRLADPAGGRDPVHRDYLTDKLNSAPANGAAQFKWTVDTNKPESAVPDERHAVLIGGSKMNELTKIRFSDTSVSGHKLSFPHTTEPIFSGTGSAGPFLTAWYYNTDTQTWTWRGSSKISNLLYTNNYIEATLSSTVGPQNFSNGSNYYFTIGGFF